MENFLKRVPLFAGLGEPELTALSDAALRQSFKKNSLVILAEDEGDTFFVIRSGRVKVSVTAPDGREIILSLLGPGDFFGELSLLDEQPRSADVTTLVATDLIALRRADFVKAVQAHPTISIHLMVTLAERLRKSDRQVAGLALLGISERISHVLLEVAESQGIETEEGILVKKRPTHQVLANMAGTARETVTRVLSRLEEEGYIEMTGKQLLIRRHDA